MSDAWWNQIAIAEAEKRLNKAVDTMHCLMMTNAVGMKAVDHMVWQRRMDEARHESHAAYIALKNLTKSQPL